MTLTTTHDVSELSQALFEESGDALFLLDPETDQLLDANPVALRLTGFSHPELLQFPAATLFRFEAAGGLQRLRGAFTKTMVFHGQDGFLLRTKADAWIPVNLTVSRLHIVPKTLGLIIARDDRDRRQAFSQARRVEAELRAVLSSSPAALWSAERAPGPDVMVGWHFRYVSPMLARLANRPDDYFDHPFKWGEVVHFSDRDEYHAWRRRLLTSTDLDAELQYRVSAVGGAVRWVRDRLQVVRDASGRPTRLDGCLVDFTEQREADEALRQNERRFRALVEKSRDGILLIDERGVILYTTPVVKEVIGYDPLEATGRDAFAFVHPDDLSIAREMFAYILNHAGEDVANTFRFVAVDGSVRVIETNACNRLADPSVQAVVMHYRDVTDRESVAREVNRQNALLEGLFASVPDIVCYKDRDLKFLGGNRAFEELAGQPVAGLIGRTCDDIFPGGWADRLRIAEACVLASGETVRGKEWVAYPDRRQALLDIAMSPLRGDDGTPTGLIVTGRDVTEQTQLEKQLQQSQKLEALGRLAGGIAHDFNNQLTVVLGNLELARGGAAGEELHDLLAASQRAAQQAADIIKQLLGFARGEPLHTSTVNLNALAEETIALLRRTIDPRITIRLQPETGLRAIAADPVRVQQVLMNLCLNARDAMPAGGTLTIETTNAGSLRRPEASMNDPETEFVRLSVADTGVGMTQEVRAKIFEPFFTTKDAGKGTGLGLAVVYGVARAHGGWVDCTSTPGNGSRFDVYLPRGIVTSEVQPEQTSVTTAPPRGHGELVLVADDEPLVRSVARSALERHGYRVLAAADGMEAVDVFRREAGAVALVVMDVSMPQMSGPQAFEAIRQIDPTARILFASGHSVADVPDIDATTAFLQKPYTPSSLTTVVRQMLDTAVAAPNR